MGFPGTVLPHRRGLAGTMSCLSLFQLPGLSPISHTYKRICEEGHIPSCLYLARRIGHPPPGEGRPFAICFAPQSSVPGCILWAGRSLCAHVGSLLRDIAGTQWAASAGRAGVQGMLALTATACLGTSPITQLLLEGNYVDCRL